LSRFHGKTFKSKPAFDEALMDFAKIGFTAVKADVPQAMTIENYRDWIAGYGLAPSLVSAFCGSCGLGREADPW
jgi:hypothetical protein